jgi:hypothetical protein
MTANVARDPISASIRRFGDAFAPPERLIPVQ